MLVKLFDAIKKSAAIERFQVGGREYTSATIFPVRQPAPEPLVVSNLSSLVAYVRGVAARDSGAGVEELVVHVEGPTVATVLSTASSQFCERKTYLKAVEQCAWKGAGQWMPPEQFIIMLQSQFLQDETSRSILALVGNIEDSAVTRFNDDGVTQQVVASTGIVRRENVAVPPRVTLTPMRSFSEATQVPSPFVLRMQSGKGPSSSGSSDPSVRAATPPQIALFEADGGAWRNQAMASVRAYLDANLPLGVVVLA